MDFKDLRWPIVIWSLVAVLGLLFGGYYAYRQFGLDRPMVRSIRAVPGVEGVKVGNRGGKMEVEVTLGSVDNLQKTYEQLEKTASDYVGPDGFDLTLVDERNPYLEATYDRMQFLVQEAIARGDFEAMYSGLQEQAVQRRLDSFHVYVSRDRVYVQLAKGANYLYAVEPRQEAMPAVTGGVGA